MSSSSCSTLTDSTRSRGARVIEDDAAYGDFVKFMEAERKKLETMQRRVESKLVLLDALLSKGALLKEDCAFISIDARAELEEWEERLVKRTALLDEREANMLGITQSRLHVLNALPHDTVVKMQAPVMSYMRRRQFTKMVHHLLQSKQHAPLRRRAKAIREILESERVYLDGLGVLNLQFISPLKHGKEIISPADQLKLFGGIELIYGLNREFYKELSQRMSEWPAKQNISDVFLKFGPSLKLYANYVEQHEDANAKLAELKKENKKFAAWLSEAEESSGGSTLQSYLILAVQRVPRYQLLLREVIKNTDPSHIDYDGLNRAYDMIKDICDYLNVRAEQHDLQHRIDAILERDNMSDPELLLLPQMLVVLSRAELDRKAAFSAASVKTSSSKERHTSTIYSRTKTPKWEDDFVFAIRPDDLDVELSFSDGAGSVPYSKTVFLDDVKKKYNDGGEHTFKLRRKKAKKGDDDVVHLTVRFHLLNRSRTQLDLSKVRRVETVDACDSARGSARDGRKSSLKKIPMERDLMALPGFAASDKGGSMIRPRSRSQGPPVKPSSVDDGKAAHHKRKEKRRSRDRSPGSTIKRRSKIHDNSKTLDRPVSGRKSRSKSPRRDSLPRQDKHSKKDGKKTKKGSRRSTGSRMHASNFGARTITAVHSAPVNDNKRLSIVVTQGNSESEGRE